MFEEQTHLLRLPDQRIIEYADYGDPQGKPVLYFHGFLGSCHQAALGDRAARHLGLRVIAPNRPGIGQSTPHHLATMTDYADDIRALLDALSIDTAACLGVSAGGCFALACTYAMPDRLRLTSVAGCVGPLNVFRNLHAMRWFRRLFLTSCEGSPLFIRAFLRGIFWICRVRPQWLYRWLVETSCLLQPGNKRLIEKLLWADYQDVFLQSHGVASLLQEARLFFHWGFSFRDFPQSARVLFWHGREDTVIPWSVARTIADSIPHAEMTLCAGGHLTFLTKVEDILRRIHREYQSETLSLPAKRSRLQHVWMLPRFS